MTDISEKVLEKIKGEHLVPEPRWKFLLKDYVFWGAFVFSVLLDGVAFGVTLYILFDSDWDIYRNINRNFSAHLLLILPYFWLIFMALFLALAHYNYKHTKGSYRHNPYLVWLLSIVFGFFIGVGSLYLEMGEKLDKIFSNQVPFYHKTMDYRNIVWNHPREGLIGGVILNLKNKSFSLRDLSGKIWNVHIIHGCHMPRVPLKDGIAARVIGEREDENDFLAKEIRIAGTNRIRMHIKTFMLKKDEEIPDNDFLKEEE